MRFLQIQMGRIKEGEGVLFYRNLTKNEPLLVGRKLTKKKGRLGMKKGLYKNRQGIFYCV